MCFKILKIKNNDKPEALAYQTKMYNKGKEIKTQKTKRKE